MRVLFILVIITILISIANAVEFVDNDDNTITLLTKMGKILGKKNKFGNSFQGIKYAHANRFESPVPIKPWSDVLDATKEGNACAQKCTLQPAACPPPDQIAEDCLFLNVFTPPFQQKKHQSRTCEVLLFIHGGGYQVGSGSGPLYEGQNLAYGEAIVVTFNYRLGALGYLYHPDAEYQLSGNYGLQDMLLVLDFVRSLISDFGGDPSKITIMGQSAGASATSTLATIAKPGMISNIIVLSNPWAIPLREADNDGTRNFMQTFLDKTNCTKQEEEGQPKTPIEVTDCIKALPVDTILEAQRQTNTDPASMIFGMIHAFLPWTPIVGTDLVPQQPFKAFSNGQIDPNMGVIFSAVSDESPQLIRTAFAEPMKSNITYSAVITGIFGFERAGKVLERYPGQPHPEETLDNRIPLIEVGNNWIFERPLLFLANQLIQHRSTPEQQDKVFVMRYEHVFSDPRIWDTATFCGKTVCHAAELPIFFGSQNVKKAGYKTTQQEIMFSLDIQAHIWNFMKTSNPTNGPHKPPAVWDSFSVSKSFYHVEQNQFVMAKLDEFEELQQFWDSIGYMWN